MCPVGSGWVEGSHSMLLVKKKREARVYGELKDNTTETGHRNESRLLLSEEPRGSVTRLFNTQALTEE